MEKEIQFHWRLLQGGEPAQLSRCRQDEIDEIALPDIEPQVKFSKLAEKAGICSLLTDIGYSKPDPLMLASGLIPFTKKIKYLIALRSGLISPTYFAQQVNTFSALSNGRILINVVAGHSPSELQFYGDFLPHNERYERSEEFLAICNGLWYDDKPVNFNGQYYKINNGQIRTPFVSDERKGPYLFIAGGSDDARNLAISQGSCWMRLPDVPEKIREAALPVIQSGKEVGLRMSIIARDTKEEAIAAAHKLLDNVEISHGEKGKEDSFVKKSDSVMMKEMHQLASDEWLTPWLWTGAVKTFGAPTIAFVGTPDEISDAIIEYKKAGVTQYILSGWPKQEEMVYFGEKLIPRVREKEKQMAYSKL